GATDAVAVMVEQLGVVAERARGFHETAGLPVRAIVDALMESENADFLPPRRHDRDNRLSGKPVPEIVGRCE
ncbi:MAG TPA: hypothetical protein VGC56_14205, partial [Allosphingosinicella sp.]